MSTFSVRAARSDGVVENLRISAPTPEAASREAAGRGLVVLEVRASESSPSRVRLSRRALLELTQSMAVLLDSGVTVHDALEMTESIFPSGSTRLYCFAVREALSRGGSFADAVSSCAQSLPALYASMVHVGERVGSLGSVFQRLARYLEDSKRMRDRVVGALIYPCIVLAGSLAGAVALMTVVMPRMTAMFEELGSALPPSYAVGRAIIFVLIGLLLACCTAGALMAVALRSARARGRTLEGIERLVLRLPLVGRYLLLRDTLNFCFALETLTGSGMSVEDALRDAGGVLSSHDYRAAVVRAREGVLRGERLSTAMASSRPIPERVARWVGLGERVGAVQTVFGQIRAYYQDEIERFTARVTALVEPALIVFVGAIVMTIVLALIVPFYSLYGSIRM